MAPHSARKKSHEIQLSTVEVRLSKKIENKYTVSTSVKYSALHQMQLDTFDGSTAGQISENKGQEIIQHMRLSKKRFKTSVKNEKRKTVKQKFHLDKQNTK